MLLQDFCWDMRHLYADVHQFIMHCRQIEQKELELEKQLMHKAMQAAAAEAQELDSDVVCECKDAELIIANLQEDIKALNKLQKHKKDAQFATHHVLIDLMRGMFLLKALGNNNESTAACAL